MRSQLFPASLELSSLDGTNGFILNGDQAGDFSGSSVSGAGDVNGDGVADFVIGAAGAYDSGKPGKSYVVFGKLGLGSGGVINLSSLNGGNGFTLNGDQANDWCGRSVSGAGDVNGDGVADLVIGARLADPTTARENAGKTYVVFGKLGLGSGGVINLSSLNGGNGFILNGDQFYDDSGWSVSRAGDVNGDGVADLVIGALFATPATGRKFAGKSYVVFGKKGLGASGTLELSSLDGTNGFILNGDQANDYSGSSVSSAGDVNGDGVADLVIGAPFATPATGRKFAGKSYVVFGKKGLGASGTLELSSLDGTNGFILNGDQANDYSGSSVSSAGDVNGDGVDDLVIGAAEADPAGKTYVVFGKPGLGASGTLELSSLDGTNGFILNGDQAGDDSGESVSSAGDVNGDGVDDLVIGAPAWSTDRPGKSYVVFGKAGLEPGGTLELSGLDGTNGFILNGVTANDTSGVSVSSSGDVNGDGVADFLIGASEATPASGREDAGKTYVVFGRRPVTTTRFSLPTTTSLSPTQPTTPPTSVTQLAFTVTQPSSALFSTSAEKTPTIASIAARLDSFDPLELPLGIGGGVCAVISSVVSALIVWRCRKRDSSAEVELDYASRGYPQALAGHNAEFDSTHTDIPREAQSACAANSPNRYQQLQLQLRPDGQDHTISVHNRAHAPRKYQSQLPNYDPHDRSHYDEWGVVEEENRQHRQEEPRLYDL